MRVEDTIKGGMNVCGPRGAAFPVGPGSLGIPSFANSNTFAPFSLAHSTSYFVNRITNYYYYHSILGFVIIQIKGFFRKFTYFYNYYKYNAFRTNTHFLLSRSCDSYGLHSF